MPVVTRQNVYDDGAFFDSYQAMRTAQTGINEAVEQPSLRALLPSLRGIAAVDLGCGDGQLCRELVEAGAATVVGVDPSARMLDLARARTDDTRVIYQQAFAEDVEVPGKSIDLVVSSLAFHYIEDIESVLLRVSAWLRPGGTLVASMEHPVRTAAPEHRADDLYGVDHYAVEGRRDTIWYRDGVIKYHRRISTIINAAIDAGLVIRRVDEPIPTEASVSDRPDLERHRRRPAIFVIAADKPSRPA
jgi:ubiquinone/menaquinone biosynthesis C-methylase UbiE